MIIGTAGHIDHGKSALVTALTGRPMDRLAEERRRGITIDLNFAPLSLEGLPPIGIVDVPGHEDFVRTMVAGASGIDLVLLVVDSAEGVRPQTLEHLAVVEQLGIPRGIPVLTKADLVDSDWMELVRSELAERLSESPVAFDEPVVVSAVTGLGLDLLRERIRVAALRLTPRTREDLFRLPVDRVFALPGVGTVVTGTVWSGAVRVGDEVVLLPGGRSARVRSIESHGQSLTEVLPGARTALGLTGVSRQDVTRGDLVLEREAPWRTVRAFDALVRLVPEAPGPLARRDRVRVHHGTAETMARIYPRTPIAEGGEGLARIALERPMVVRGGDRFVIRRYSPVTTIGGGTVVDPTPPPRSAWPESLASSTPAARLPALVARRGHGVPAGDLAVLLGVPPAQVAGIGEGTAGIVQIAGRWFLTDRVQAVEASILARLDAHHSRDPSSPGLSVETIRSGLGPSAPLADPVIRNLVTGGRVVQREGLVARAGFTPRARGGEEEVRRLVETIEAAGLEPPTTGELVERLRLLDAAGALRIAASRGLIESVEPDRFFSRSALERFREAVVQAGAMVEIVPAALRERLGISRKFLIPLLEWSDRRGITVRDANGVRRLRK
ncbi:MAG TPA: selenocysteine-specific translation elongation factor [Gemmatimonadales bacterium]